MKKIKKLKKEIETLKQLREQDSYHFSKNMNELRSQNQQILARLEHFESKRQIVRTPSLAKEIGFVG